MNNQYFDSIFYHIYPLGFCGAPQQNDFTQSPINRLSKIEKWIDHMLDFGIDSLYLGPVFESTTHGYDTKDYYLIDRRLGNNDDFKQLCSVLHNRGIKIVLDGVFHHVGRDFPPFTDLQKNFKSSQYIDWFSNVNFNGRSPYNDNFSYDGWNGHYSLVKLNLKNPGIKAHLFQAVQFWIREFNIDGLRLDAADYIDKSFLSELAAFCRNIKPDFWLMGEVIAGDYRHWVNKSMLDSVTNYECYKGMYSSLNDKNYFEIAYSLNREFGETGMYKDLLLYNFADNHDVDRVTSILKNETNIYPLVCILFTIPGIPSIYYGSEWGIHGKKTNNSDQPLRPALDLDAMTKISPHPDLIKTYKKLIDIRKQSPALKYGNYRQLYVSSEQFAFSRTYENKTTIVVLNSSDNKIAVELNVPGILGNARYTDRLNNDEAIESKNSKIKVDLWPNWARILELKTE